MRNWVLRNEKPNKRYVKKKEKKKFGSTDLDSHLFPPFRHTTLKKQVLYVCTI